jgi:putative transposase
VPKRAREWPGLAVAAYGGDMPRPLRIQYPGAVYHVMSRGVRGLPLYVDAEDRRAFLVLLDETCTRYDWLIQAYCLMGNHYHLLVTTLRATLSRGSQWLNGQYVSRFNKRHGHVGYGTFRRFRAVLVKEETQFATTARYILRNPVRASLCERPSDWSWSSYRAMLGKETVPSFLEATWILGEFGLTLEQAQANFAAYVNAVE